ncbi:MAG: transglutaminase family protein [Pseudomonadota bacterium]
MRLKVHHVSEFAYPGPVPYALHQARLTPKNNAMQTILDWSLTISGGDTQAQFHDHHHNQVTLISQHSDSSAIRIEAHGEIDTKDGAGVIGKHGGYSPLWLFLRQTPITAPGKGVRALARNFNGKSEDTLGMLHDLSAAIVDAVDYQVNTTNVDTSAEEALRGGQGVCQDHAHVFLSAARLLDVPCRYVSGYLMMDDRVLQDATHAWVEAHVPQLGWVGFDVSNRISPDERYVRVATGLDYSDAAPLKGLRLGTQPESLVVSVQVQQ